MVEAPVSLETRASSARDDLGYVRRLADVGEMAVLCLDDEVQRFALKELFLTITDKLEE